MRANVTRGTFVVMRPSLVNANASFLDQGSHVSFLDQGSGLTTQCPQDARIVATPDLWECYNDATGCAP